MKISVVILTKNEEKNIEDCIKSLDFCNETIVIDDNSTDKTIELAKSLGSRVFLRDLNADFAAQRNFGLSLARGEWVLFIDADERIPQELKKEILKKLKLPSVVKGYFLRRKDFLWGKELKYGETASASFLRLARGGFGKWKRKVHEVWEVEGQKAILKNPILHYPHQTLREFISEINFYSTLSAEENLKVAKTSSILKVIFWPKFKFLHNFLLRLGILDWTYGFVIAMMMSFHSFLSWSKQWIRQERN